MYLTRPDRLPTLDRSLERESNVKHWNFLTGTSFYSLLHSLPTRPINLLRKTALRIPTQVACSLTYSLATTTIRIQLSKHTLLCWIRLLSPHVCFADSALLSPAQRIGVICAMKAGMSASVCGSGSYLLHPELWIQVHMLPVLI